LSHTRVLRQGLWHGVYSCQLHLTRDSIESCGLLFAEKMRFLYRHLYWALFGPYCLSNWAFYLGWASGPNQTQLQSKNPSFNLFNKMQIAPSFKSIKILFTYCNHCIIFHRSIIILLVFLEGWNETHLNST
jgi:hypothetical protein